MIVITGKSVYKDICSGKIIVYKKKEITVKCYQVDDVNRELRRLDDARIKAKNSLQELYEKALADAGGKSAAIFELHQVMLDDPDYYESIKNNITTNQINAEYAVSITADNFVSMFKAMDDIYIKGRAADVRDVSERLILILNGAAENEHEWTEKVIILADDLSPSETIRMDKSKVSGFLIRQGSLNSHTAILSRSMGIPMLINIGGQADEKFDGKMTIIDGFDGMAYIEPDENILAQMQEKKEKHNTAEILLKNQIGKDDITIDKRRMNVFANIGNLADLAIAIANDARGIGLFRSEFLYLGNHDYPTEEQQFQIYKQAAEKMAGKPVVIRTLDLGTDKQADYFKLPYEANPALGYRAIRICLTKPEIFKTQLRALYRASQYGNIKIMYPMIISMDEVKQIKVIEDKVKAKLDYDIIPYNKDIETGIMIETPAAALISDQLAKEVDFFSIGTNDLTQYTLAVDRLNPNLEMFFNPYHEALFKLIRMAADNIHREKKWIGICGELAEDLNLTEQFLRMGIDEISVSPFAVLKVRDKIRSLDLKPSSFQ